MTAATAVAVARVLDGLLTRAQAGPPDDKASARVAARDRVAAAARRPPAPEAPPVNHGGGDEAGERVANAIPLGIFNARAEADRWPS